MARIRTVKPELWIDEKIVDLSFAARLLFIGLWNFADDQGYIDDKPRRIKMQVFPEDSLNIVELVDELVTAGLLARYQSPIGPVLHVRNWDKHQKVDRASAPRFDPTQLVLIPPPSTQPTSAQVSPRREDTSSTREDSPASLDAEGKGSGPGPGPGRDLDQQHASRAAAPLRDTAGADPPPTPTQRSKPITDAYHAAEPLSNWPAINAIVIKAIKAKRWTDDEIREALLRLAEDGRGVTVETLRVELNGLPPGRASPNGLVDRDGLRLTARNAAHRDDRARYEAMDAARAQPPAIGGTDP